MKKKIVNYGAGQDISKAVEVWVIAKKLCVRAYFTKDAILLEDENPSLIAMIHEAHDSFKHDKFSLVFMGNIHGIVNVDFGAEDEQGGT